jgi:hypothetical protein
MKEIKERQTVKTMEKKTSKTKQKKEQCRSRMNQKEVGIHLGI